ncbi:hypothetical protein FS749_005038 [Ceratobasidium sp. UAMH 11750]|nr:hypothetical protein FS749_005038 [Ceratobasidium sp. UAMH 11750]
MAHQRSTNLPRPVQGNPSAGSSKRERGPGSANSAGHVQTTASVNGANLVEGFENLRVKEEPAAPCLCQLGGAPSNVSGGRSLRSPEDGPEMGLGFLHFIPQPRYFLVPRPDKPKILCWSVLNDTLGAIFNVDSYTGVHEFGVHVVHDSTFNAGPETYIPTAWDRSLRVLKNSDWREVALFDLPQALREYQSQGGHIDPSAPTYRYLVPSANSLGTAKTAGLYHEPFISSLLDHTEDATAVTPTDRPSPRTMVLSVPEDKRTLGGVSEHVATFKADCKKLNDKNLRVVCSHCGTEQKYTDPAHLRRHLFHHFGIKEHKCDQCVYSSVNKQDLEKHKASRHPPPIINEGEPEKGQE